MLTKSESAPFTGVPVIVMVQVSPDMVFLVVSPYSLKSVGVPTRDVYVIS